MNSIRCPINKIALTSRADSVALRSGPRYLTYRNLEQLIDAYVAVLRSARVRSGSRIALWPDPSMDFIVAYFALIRLGAISCLLNSRWPANRCRTEAKRLGCRKIIALAAQRSKFSAFQIIDPPDTSNSTDGAFRRLHKSYQTHQPANIIFTSGTSGHSKAIVHTVGNHHFSALGSNRHIPLGPHDAWLLSLPLYHVSGLSIVWRCVEAGATVLIPESREGVATCLRNQEITHLSCVATQLQDLLQRSDLRPQLKALKALLLGGSAIPRNLVRHCLKRQIALYASYGLTEMSSQVATTGQIQQLADMGQAKILLHRQVTIGAGDQILVRGRTLSPGIWAGGRLKALVGRHGWYATGDRGRRLRNGTVEVLGRMDNMFISGGENIYPEEVEKVLLKLPQISKAIVYPRRSARYGCRPVAVICCYPKKKVSARLIKAYLSRHLEKFKIPDEYYKWPESVEREDLKIDRHQVCRAVNRGGPKWS